MKETAMNMELHSTGASFVAGKQDNNPRDLVLRVIKNMPDDTRQERFEEFRTMLKESADDYQRMVDWYFFVNMHDYVVTDRNRKKNNLSQVAEDRRMQTSIAQTIKSQIMLLDLTMTNGKAMRECTGAEMATMGNRFQKIAERVGKTKTVGSVLSEEQVKTILT